ncbi:hypothetical protein ABXS75_00190 [Roseburia hominis]
MVDFLHYVEKSSDECLPEVCDERLKHLHEIVKNIKASKQMGVTYMKMEERDRLIREKGEKLGEKRGEQRISKLYANLVKDNRVEEILKADGDQDFREELLKEYGL